MESDSAVAYIDGSSRGNPGPSGIGVVIYKKNNLEEPIVRISRYLGITTNNVAEYEALIYGLKWLLNNQFYKADIYLDSELVYRQLTGEYRVKTQHIQILVERTKKLLNRFEKVDLKFTPRKNNSLANQLAQGIVKTMMKKRVKKE